MPAGRRIARFNKVVTNRTIGKLGSWAPGFGVVTHRGRKSGRVYQTPVNLFRRGDGFVFALTYGSKADWVKNVLAAGEFDVSTRGRTYHLVEPRLYRDPKRSEMPVVVRFLLRLTKVDEFVRTKIAPR